MRNSLRLGKYFDVDVGVHWSVLLIAALLTSSLAGTILPSEAPGYAAAGYLIAALATTGLFLVSIVAHELGHSVVAKNNDVGVSGITLFALGGVAALKSEPATPGAAARIALAGPAVSVAVGVASLLGAAAAGAVGLPGLAVVGLTWLGFINLVLAVFNMVPALPLDGGRVLQAALWKRTNDRHRSTIGAATVGRYLGWGFVGLGLWQFTQGGAGLWTAFIGMFIITSARREEFTARYQQRRNQWARNWMAWTTTSEGPTGPKGPRPSREDVIDVDVIDVDAREVDSPA